MRFRGSIEHLNQAHGLNHEGEARMSKLGSFRRISLGKTKSGKEAYLDYSTESARSICCGTVTNLMAVVPGSTVKVRGCAEIDCRPKIKNELDRKISLSC